VSPKPRTNTFELMCACLYVLPHTTSVSGALRTLVEGVLEGKVVKPSLNSEP
jgi:hypothetical protein